MADTQEPSIVSGVYESVVAVPDPIAAIKFWERFGYRVGETGRLDAADAKALYGVNANLTSTRLHHMDSDHGLVRVMSWDKTMGPGLEYAPLRVRGSRWTGTRTENINRIYTHIDYAQRTGQRIEGTPAFFYRNLGGPEPEPFGEEFLGVIEGSMITPLSRMVLHERVGYDMPLYGKVNPASLFQASQFTAVNIVVEDDDKTAMAFYDNVLGMYRRLDVERNDDDSPGNLGSIRLLNAKVGQFRHGLDFDDPRSRNTLAERRAGVLKVLRYKGLNLPDKRDLSCPGNYGNTLFTARVKPFEAMREKMQGAGATAVTKVMKDEFGQRAYSCNTPDGFAWTFIEA